ARPNAASLSPGPADNRIHGRTCRAAAERHPNPSNPPEAAATGGTAGTRECTHRPELDAALHAVLPGHRPGRCGRDNVTGGDRQVFPAAAGSQADADLQPPSEVGQPTTPRQ